MEKGFYYNGMFHSLIEIDHKKYRHRVEILVLKDESVFISKSDTKDYRLPGGSTEQDCSPMRQVVNECHEEALIDVKKVKHYPNSTYIQTYDFKNPRPKWMNDLPVLYDGMYTEVYVGTYNGKWTKPIAKEDLAPNIAAGKFVPLSTAFMFIRDEHKKAILAYLKDCETDLNFYD